MHRMRQEPAEEAGVRARVPPEGRRLVRDGFQVRPGQEAQPRRQRARGRRQGRQGRQKKRNAGRGKAGSERGPEAGSETGGQGCEGQTRRQGRESGREEAGCKAGPREGRRLIPQPYRLRYIEMLSPPAPMPGGELRYLPSFSHAKGPSTRVSNV